jgi:large subunit ribosomal protein L13
MKTSTAGEKDLCHGWHVVDASDKPLGRLAVRIATVLRGRHKVSYMPHIDMGDFVVVVNADKVKLTGKKEEQKTYDRYSGFRGGLRRVPAFEVRKKHPDWMVKLAVRGMLPKNHLSRKLLTRLKVYAGDKHPHAAQNPEPMKV